MYTLTYSRGCSPEVSSRRVEEVVCSHAVVSHILNGCHVGAAGNSLAFDIKANALLRAADQGSEFRFGSVFAAEEVFKFHDLIYLQQAVGNVK